ncbi:MAG TPA: PadR family transcriptional regulator [Acidimicrobiales bacterium]
MTKKTAISNDLARPNEPAVLILTSLASGTKHGYALTKDIEEFAGVELGPGTLYGALARLVERGLIAPVPSEDRRQPYEITASGRAALTDTVRAMQSLANEGAARLRLRNVARPLVPTANTPKLAR